MRNGEKNSFEIRQVDAWKNEEDAWYWNTSYRLGVFSVLSYANEKRAFLRALHKPGIVLAPNKHKVVCIDDIFEVQNRATDEPVLAAIPIN